MVEIKECPANGQGTCLNEILIEELINLLWRVEKETRRKEMPCILCGNHPLYEKPHDQDCELAKRLS